MRVVFVNLHCNEFLVKTASKYIFKQAIAIKHKYLLDYLLNDTDFEVCSYVNKNGTSIASNLPRFLMKILIACRFLESKWILRKNGIHKRITILKNINEINSDDIVILYQLYAERSPELGKVKAFKVMSMLHFFGTQVNSDAIQQCGPDLLVNECDLKSHCELFRKYYSWYQNEIIVHPFVAAERFQFNKPFEERANRVFSTGTITYKTHDEFISIYGNPCLQPMRKYVKDHQEELIGVIDCYSSDFSESANEKMKAKQSDNRFIKLIKAGYYKFFASQQKSYFSFNMVEKFNEYKVFLVGEEILGIPGIGFVEGMSCGCAYIGQRGLYEQYGMQEGVHYIGYDGTPEKLIETIRYYQLPEHQLELKRIAENGYQFAKEHFKGEMVAKNLMDKLISERNKYLSRI